MEDWFLSEQQKRQKRQKIKQYGVTILVVSIILVVAIALIIIGYRFDWTGFNGNNKSGKTLWDWLQLLAALTIPVVVGFGAVWFTTKFSEQQSRTEHEIASDNQCETALQAYIDKMSELLLKEHLGELKSENEEVRKIARIRTLTVLRRLDAERKGSVLLFLHESGLIGKDKRIINLTGAILDLAELSGTELSGADLRGANLSGVSMTFAKLISANLSGVILNSTMLQFANLTGADLRETYMNAANLRGANLSGVDLSKTYLTGANLSEANLSGATITQEKLETISRMGSLKGATMPDGTLHP
jgi:hypothetical protein